ncbi:MAG: tRNA lysidine(34) synthetase TilS, partial [Parachlamydiales bacterium]
KGIGRTIESKVRKALKEFSMLESANSLAVALSGGKDSLCLLFMLKAVIGKGFKNIDFYAIHIDGDFSCGASYDKNYLNELCKQYDIKFISKELKNNSEKLDCYSCSRNRRKLIFDTARENNISTIAFGHHQDDNVQTLLLNLFHKAEFEGMMPKIKFKRFGVSIIRPLIYVNEHEIIEFAKQNDILKVFCKCPIGQNSKRKTVKKIIEDIKLDFPNVKSNLSKASFVYGSKKALCE